MKSWSAGAAFPPSMPATSWSASDGAIARPLALFRVVRDGLTFETYVALDGRAIGVPKGSDP